MSESKPYRKPLDIDEVRSLRSLGISIPKIAALLHYDAAYLSNWCSRNKVTIRERSGGPKGGEDHFRWKGGRHVDKDGYVMIYAPNHPHRRKHVPYVAEHRLVMEKHLGRVLLPHEVVHHKDKNKQNNDLSNLELFQSNSEHLKHELTGHCPKWSDDGKEAMLRSAARKRENAIRKRSERDALLSSQTTARSTV